MKKRFLSILTFVLTLIVAVPLFTACNDNKDSYTISFVKYETTTKYTDLNYNTAIVEVVDLSNSKSFKAEDFKVVVNGTKVDGSSLITGFQQESYEDFDTCTAIHSQSVIAEKNEITTITIVFGIDDINQIEGLYYKSKKLN